MILTDRWLNLFRQRVPRLSFSYSSRTDCPICNSYAPEIRRLKEAFGPRGVTFWLVYPDPDLAVKDIRDHLKEYQLGDTALRDPKLELVQACRVRVTPEAAVFDPDGRLVYHGRIDDRYAALGMDRQVATKRDLNEVLKAITAGESIAPTSTKAVGCGIPGVR